MKSDSLKKNMLLQFAYQFIVLIIPLIMAPYLTRNLGETAIGIYSYTYSIAYYFVLFCMLGIVKHGQRIIAKRKNNEIYLRKTFWSLYVVHSFFSIIGLLAYLLFCFILYDENLIVYIAQSLYVLSAFFDITWFFYGIENFKIVVIRNATIKIIELLLVFVFVKSSSDLINYTLIMSMSALLSQILLFPTVIKLARPIKISMEDICEHIKPLLVLSVSVFAISMFTVFDKTLLGILTTAENVAFYEYANKIINIPKMFIVVVGTVIFPRACNCVACNDLSGIKRYYRYSILMVYFIGFASIFGLIGVSDLFSIIYFGESFAICGTLIKTLSPIVLIIGIGDIFRTQFLIPLKKDLQYTVCVIINALINVCLSLVLIPRMGMYGAVIGTISAELFGLIYQGYLIKEYVNLYNTVFISFPFLVAGAFMLLVINVLKSVINTTLLHLILQIIFGGIIYVTIVTIWFIFFDKDRFEFKKILSRFIKNQRSIE